MIDFVLPSGPLAVACLGAHPDDIEIGCGGTLLALAASRDLTVDYVVMTGSEDRHQEARTASAKFMPGATITHHLHSLPDGRLPGYWDEVKQELEDVRARPAIRTLSSPHAPTTLIRITASSPSWFQPSGEAFLSCTTRSRSGMATWAR